MSLYLLIDCGGTKTAFHTYVSTNDPDLLALHQTTYLNKDFDSFYELLQHFIDHIPSVNTNYSAILIAAAGSISNDSVKLTNLDWTISQKEIKKRFPRYSIKTNIYLINDLEATAYYPLYSGSADNIIRIGGTSEYITDGSYTVLSVGTGFGTAFAAYESENRKYVICSGEGGHSTFAPSTKDQQRLFDYYQRQDPDKEISVEFFLSGEGLSRIYTYLSDGNTKAPEDISKGASKKCPICLQSIDLFFEILSCSARNVALFPVPKKGLYLTGGVITHLLPFLDHKTFIRHFTRSEKMSVLLKKIPVYIIDGHQAPIHGLLYYLKNQMRFH